MAVTKIKPIRGTVNKAIAYIIDPKKTDDELLVSSFSCAASDAAAKEFEWTRNLAAQQGAQIPTVLARHLIQSFDVGEVSPEVAHEIGKQFADEWLKGKYEYVIATHIDKGHCHNHIIFNAVNFVDYHSYRSNKRTYRELRQLSDAICKEHGLSVIPPSQNKGMDYKEYTEAKRGTSWKQKLRQTIDRLVITANDWDEFLKLMQEAGYEIKPGKYISFRAEGQERFTRAKTIGENYSEERLKERIAGRNPRKQQMQTERKGISLIIDIQNSIKAQESKGYEHWAKINNLKQAAKTLNFLTEHGLTSYAELEAKVAQELKENNMEEQCIVTSFKQRSLVRIKKDDPDIVTGYIYSFGYSNRTNYEAMDVLSIDARYLTRQVVTGAHKKGIMVCAWTVNTSSEMRRMMAIGVDNIITDRVPLAKRTLKHKDSNAVSDMVKYIFEQ